DIVANVRRHAALASAAAAHGARLALFPELSLTGYEPDIAAGCIVAPHDSRLAPLAELAVRTRMTIVAGAPVSGTAGALHIGALCFLPDGRVEVYTKQHLHPGEDAVFAPGAGGPPLGVGGTPVALAVCAEIAHASHAQAAARGGAALYAASVLVSPGGYAKDSGLLQGYAASLGMPVLMANHGGPTGGWQSAGRSALWNEEGKLLAAAPEEGEWLVLAGRRAGRWEVSPVRPAIQP
ncbi:MAG TPA: carbon-nitrogen hydrolase family protein, partial [Pseudoduganella sp.]